MGGLIWKATAYRFLDTLVLIYPFYTVMFAGAGLTPIQIGVVLAAWSMTAIVLEIPTGALADRVSRRWLLLIAQLIRGVSFLLWFLFPGFWGFLIGLVLWGVKTALVSGTFEALLFDELKAQGREHLYARAIGRAQTDTRFQHALSGEARATVASVKGFASQCAIMLLILNFGLMAEFSSYRTAFMVQGIALTLLGAAYALWMLRSRRPDHLA